MPSTAHAPSSTPRASPAASTPSVRPPHHRPPSFFRRRDQSAEGPQHATQRGGSKTRARAGDSFTHCDQVSDGETWQEFLASHIREPVKNFGVGEPS